jgi:hypothetical protein
MPAAKDKQREAKCAFGAHVRPIRDVLSALETFG